VQTNFNEVLNLSGGSLPDWPDLMVMYEALADPNDAFNRWNTTSFVFDGETRAHEYAWIRTLQALGQVQHSVTANWPFYAVFRNPGTGVVTHIAFNPTSTTATVNFSDGASLSVSPRAVVSDNGSSGGVPAAPSNLAATATSSSSINLSWSASTTPGVTYSVFRSTTNGFTPSASNQIGTGIGGTSFTNDSGLSPSTTYFYRVTAVNAAGSSPPSNQASATTPAAGLTAPWQDADIGSVTPAGSASLSSGVFTVRGAGADIWGNADAFHFVYQSLTGDGDIVARVTAVQNTNAWAKAGVMIRETLAAGSEQAFMCLTPGNGLAFQRRVSTNGVSTHTSGGAGSAPVWVRVVRNGNTLTGFRSTDGVNWTQVGSDTIAMAAPVFVGLALTSHANGTINTSTFDNVRVSAAAASGAVSVNSGGGAAGTFVADTNFSGGTAASTTAAIDTSLISAPAPPQAVYQTERFGASTYTFGGFTPGSSHTVALHFAEFFFSAVGQRRFNVLINGTQVLTNFDIIANTGAKNKAIQENFSTVANASGQIVIQFTVGAADLPKISGLVIQ
jgi:malectin (di-glucose binding ER protein)/fibronectin type III domain protein